MMPETQNQEKDCPWCGKAHALKSTFPGHHDAQVYDCPCCGPFVLWRHEVLTALSDPFDLRTKRCCEFIPPLIRERVIHNREATLCILFTRPSPYPTLPGCEHVFIDELLAQFPHSVAERIPRILGNLVAATKKPGFRVPTREMPRRNYLFFTDVQEEQRFYKIALQERGWIEKRTDAEFIVSPQGWMAFEKLRASRKENFAFIAMVFGKEGPERTRMDAIHNAIKDAIRAVGYKSIRADETQDNEPVMGRILADIGAAPFVVAEFTRDNQGVYYEAGYAMGKGIPVIHCVPSKGERPHFDVSAINQVQWGTKEELGKRLSDRILWSIGEGPFAENATE